jgi:hypothetical protein
MADASERMNGAGTCTTTDTPATQPGSRDVLQQTYRDLMALRIKHGAGTPIGYRCSNIMELLRAPEAPREFLRRQMDDLQRLLGS